MGLRKSGDSYKIRPSGAPADVLEVTATGMTLTGDLAVTGTGPWPRDRVCLFSGNVSASSASLVAAQFRYDTAEHTGSTVTLSALLESTQNTVTASLELYNVTDDVTVYTLTSVSQTPEYVSHAVTMASGAKVYKLVLSQSGGGVSDAATLTMAQLIVS
jgi:hypothetical protein